MLGAVDDDSLARALDYPYRIPAGSFLFDVDQPEVTAIRPQDLEDLARGRHAVLAIGSNASPEQLRRKLVEHRGDRRVPVVAVTLHDHDVVYAARLSSYGSVPATLLESPGTAAEVKLTLLTDAQRHRLDGSEALGTGYEVVDLDAAHLTVDGRAVTIVWPALDRVTAYRAMAGPLRDGGDPVALAAVAASGRRWPSRTEAEVLELLAGSLKWTTPELVERVLLDEAQRLALNDRLRARQGRLPGS